MFQPSSTLRGLRAVVSLSVALVLIWSTTGCLDQEYLVSNTDSLSSFKRSFNPKAWVGPTPSDRSLKTLQKFNLVVQDDSYWIRHYSIKETLQRLEDSLRQEVTPEKQYALSELAFLDGESLLADDQRHQALERFCLSLVHAYGYLVTPEYQHLRNPYDPQFQDACQLYNQSLEKAMRIIAADNQLRDGTTFEFSLGGQQTHVEIRFPVDEKKEPLTDLQFVSDFKIQKLLRHHRTFGLGVPMIGIRYRGESASPVEQYYTPAMSSPLTAFMRVANPHPAKNNNAIQHCILEFYDTVDISKIQVNRTTVPLQTDTSIPLAFLLDQNSLVGTREASTTLILDPTDVGVRLFMIEPYDPGKIPVIMVHGFWSSPMMWMNMVNDLRSFPEIRQNYQFWFYQYPTSQPFWISASKLRATLHNLYRNLDPYRQHTPLHHGILVGHSMGGLISFMQTLDSQNAMWNLISNQPFSQLQAPQDILHNLANTVFFQPNPSISKVITIATPYQGSRMANDYTKWLGNSFFKLPEPTDLIARQLIDDNPNFFHNTQLLTTKTSLESLAPDGRIFKFLQKARRSDHTSYHNIYGDSQSSAIINQLAASSDGVVSTLSARSTTADTELAVDANHVSITDIPQTILEVRRILQMNLMTQPTPHQPVSYEHQTLRPFKAPESAPGR